MEKFNNYILTSANAVEAEGASNLASHSQPTRLDSFDLLWGCEHPLRPCPICRKMQVKLTRYIKFVHKNEVEVQTDLASYKIERCNFFWTYEKRHSKEYRGTVKSKEAQWRVKRHSEK